MEEKERHSFIIANFNDIEEKLYHCLAYIPFIERNKNVISPKFISIILESCSLIESLFYEFHVDKDKKYSFKDYAILLDDKNELSNAISIFLISPIHFFNPFKTWRNDIPEWWNSYNKLKHDRITNYHFATYLNAINSAVALHQIISKTHMLIPELISADWFNSDSEDVAELISAQLAGNAIPIQTIPVASRLFVSPLDSNFVEIKNDVPYIENCNFTNKVLNAISVYEFFT